MDRQGRAPGACAQHEHRAAQHDLGRLLREDEATLGGTRGRLLGRQMASFCWKKPSQLISER